MIFLESLLRVFKMGFTNFWRNIWLSTATVLVMILTLLSFSMLVILNLMGKEAIANIKDKIEITINLKNGQSEEKIQALREEIAKLPKVTGVEYISAEQTLEKFRQKHKEDRIISDILKEFSDNPLEPALVIRAEQPEDYPAIVEKLEEARFKEFIRKINFQDNEPMIAKLTAAANSLEDGGIIVSVIFAAIAILVMFNTIRLTIYSRSKEIEIMKLVGATNWYVRWPMIVEGILYGFVASAISLAILFPVTNIFSPKIETYFQEYGLNLAHFFNAHIFAIIGLQILVAVSLGVISSYIATQRYLSK